MNQIYVTWDATSYGVRRAGIIDLRHDGVYAMIETGYGAGHEEWIPRGYWFKTYRGALASAERQRKAKIVQLEAQIKRLQEMELK